jgi:DNA/RNA-binding protein KIN17
MGKHEVMTPKAIAKKIKVRVLWNNNLIQVLKAKGLQKLRWYCQMCEKQCRDANGFKCHMESESHLRQMSIFGNQSGKFIDGFSKDFEAGFMDIVKRRYTSTTL